MTRVNVLNVQICLEIMIKSALFMPYHENCLVPTCDCLPKRRMYDLEL